MKFDRKQLLEQKTRQIEQFLRELTTSEAEKPTMIVIGGLAIRAYGSDTFSHDGDVMVDRSTFSALRDRFVVHRTERLGKSEFLTPFGADIDVYVEHRHKLRVPFEQLQAYAIKKNDLWVACPEHLLVLKLEAYKARRNTDKGLKDIQDILYLVARTEFHHRNLLREHLSQEDWELLQEVTQTPENWQRFVHQNFKRAAELQKQATAALKTLQTPDLDID